MSAIMLDGAMVHYEALGRGRPIVFLHGWVGSWRYWITAMQVASTSFRAYALDLYGYGDTAHDPANYSVEKQAGLLNRFLSEMGIAKIAIVGHGLGALVGLSFIEQFPQSVDRIMAVNCPLSLEAIHPRLRTAPMAELVDWLSVRTPEGMAALGDAGKADPLTVSASINSLQADNLIGTVHAAGTPCLFVSGQNDPAISMPEQDRSATLPTMIHHIVLEETGHFPMLEDPLRFNRLMTDFMTLDPGVSPKELQLKEEWRRRVR
ncbi:MAG: alpha/beta fold hydrolase [Bacteroidota bacterium]